MDVITTFLNGKLNEEVLMEIPEGFPGAGDQTKVCKINRALYGLKQASRPGTNVLTHGSHVSRSTNDPNLYFSVHNGKRTILLLYVDDLLLTGDDSIEIDRIKMELSKEFEMTNLGLAHNYLGVEIVHQDNGIFIHQKTYIQKLLKKFGLQNCNPTNLPMDPKLQLQHYTGSSRADPLTYRSLVGSLIYLTNTRPDICFAVSCVEKYMDSPEQIYFQAAKKILQY
jgi:hypothetical protein